MHQPIAQTWWLIEFEMKRETNYFKELKLETFSVSLARDAQLG